MPTELADAALTAGNGARFDLLTAFLLSYVAILVTPGPNLFAVGSIAALRGLRGAVPICLGIASGVGALGAGLLFMVEAAADRILAGETAGRVVATLLLLGTAVFVARLPQPPNRAGSAVAPGRPGVIASRAAAFGAGFCTAVTNPLTGAFFAAQFLGPLGAELGRATALLILLGVAAMALAFMLTAAVVLSRPAVRWATLKWHRPLRAMASAALLAMGGMTLWPVLWP